MNMIKRPPFFHETGSSCSYWCGSVSSCFFNAGSGSSLKNCVTSYRMKSFLELKKTKKIAQKLKIMELIQIYLHLKKIKLQWLTICLHFFIFSSNFSLLDPDPGGKMNADPCESGSTALVLSLSPFFHAIGYRNFLVWITLFGETKRRGIWTRDYQEKSCPRLNNDCKISYLLYLHWAHDISRYSYINCFQNCSPPSPPTVWGWFYDHTFYILTIKGW